MGCGARQKCTSRPVLLLLHYHGCTESVLTAAGWMCDSWIVAWRHVYQYIYSVSLLVAV